MIILKSAVILLAEGFEEIEAITIIDVLRRGDVKCDICSIRDRKVIGSHKIKIKADILLSEIEIDSYEAVILPGGMPGAKNLKEDSRVIDILKRFQNKNKMIGAICAAPIVLKEAGIIKDKTITCYPDFKEEFNESNYTEDIVTNDGNIFTSPGPATAIYFALEILRQLTDEQIYQSVKKGMLVNIVEEYNKVN